VGSAASRAHGLATINVRDNHFKRRRSGVVVATVGNSVEPQHLRNAPDGPINLIGPGAVMRATTSADGAAMGIIAETAREALIESNELAHIKTYAIMVPWLGQRPRRGTVCTTWHTVLSSGSG